MSVDFYTCDDSAEEYTSTDRDECIRDYLDGMLDPQCNVLERLPKTVTVFSAVRGVLPADEPYLEHVLESILESLDEEYGSPHEYSKPTPKMIEAGEAFLKVIRAEYIVWSCSIVGKEEVEVEPWVREHEPEWLGES